MKSIVLNNLKLLEQLNFEREKTYKLIDDIVEKVNNIARNIYSVVGNIEVYTEKHKYNIEEIFCCGRSTYIKIDDELINTIHIEKLISILKDFPNLIEEISKINYSKVKTKEITSEIEKNKQIRNVLEQYYKNLDILFK